MPDKPPRSSPHTAAILLAAGASTRLGEPKQLVELNGEPLLCRALRIAHQAGLAPIEIVLGANAERIQRTCNLENVTLNPDWSQGMGTSIRAGIAALQQRENDAAAPLQGVVVMTCDQPAVDAAHLQELVRWGSDQAEPIASRYAGQGEKERHGVPAYFPRTRFPELLLLTGDTGARSLLASAKSVKLDLGELDIDTAEALERARQLFKHPGGGPATSV